jgi:methionine aminopeptidase
MIIIILKINSDLGVHVDGYMALVAYTKVCAADGNKAVEGRKADAILAAYNGI